MAYTLGNKCAKNLCKRIVLLQLIIENVVTSFFATQCIMERTEIKTGEVIVKHAAFHSEKVVYLESTNTDEMYMKMDRVIEKKVKADGDLDR